MKKNEQLFDAMTGFDDALITAAAPRAAKKAVVNRRRWLTAPIAAAIAILLTVGAAAAGTVAIMKWLNDPVITENNTQLTEVPEGYVGIYSVADLVKLAEDVKNDVCAENYILMADITFTDADYAPGGLCEGGWEPIQLQHRHYYMPSLTEKEDGTTVVSAESKIPCTVADITAEYSEMGKYNYGYSVDFAPLKKFNGNGHVIRNLKIDQTIVTDQLDDPYFIGLFGNAGQTVAGAQIINLGLEGIDITLHGTPDTLTEQISIGGIAGAANYIGACYVKDMTLSLELTDIKEPLWYNGEAHPWPSGIYLLVGGIAGEVDFADACYAEDYTMNIKANGFEHVYLNGGGIAARVQAAVTCWSQGNWNAVGNAYATASCDELTPASNRIHLPPLIPGESFDAMIAKAEAHYGEDAFEIKKIRAYFQLVSLWDGTQGEISEQEEAAYNATYKRNISLFNKMYALTQGSEEEISYDTYYFYDPWISEIENAGIRELLVAAYGSEEAFDAFCDSSTMKTGSVYCASPTGGAKADYPGFDFDSLWVLVDGIPRLRIFE